MGQLPTEVAQNGPALDDGASQLLRGFPEPLLVVDRASLCVLGASRVAETELEVALATLQGRPLAELIDGPLPEPPNARAPVWSRRRWLAGVEGPVEVGVRVAPGTSRTWMVQIRRGSDPSRIAEELRQAHRFLEAVVENIPDMVFVKRASDHTFIRFNRAGEALLGWDRHHLLGRSDYDVFPKDEADWFRARDLEIYASGEPLEVREERITTRDKGTRWLHTKKVPVYDGDRPLYLVGVSEDITERKLAEERAGALERELAEVVLKATDAIVTWTPEDGRIVSHNPAAALLYGLEAGQAGEITIDTLVPVNLRAELQANVERLLTGQKLAVAQTSRLRRGLEVDVEESLSLIPGSIDRPARVASIAREIGAVARLRRAAEILAGPAAESEAEASESAPAMREVIEAADMVARDNYASVLLLGETGVGKSWLARRIHQRSERGKQPFLDINCAGLAPQLLETELFGYERGAFTGAAGPKRGLVEAADGGTLLLDEVGELPTNVQAQLLTFLDGHRFRRVGGTRVMQADVRVLAATNLNLAERVATGQFRMDLFYRLSVVPIRIPPLRERREELSSLALSILTDLGRRAGRRERAALAPGVLRALEGYDWPGNLRELRNALERALILSRGEPIEVRHLPPEIRSATCAMHRPVRLEEVGRAHILRVLDSCGGNRTRAATVLGISRSTLKRQLAEMLREGADRNYR